MTVGEALASAGSIGSESVAPVQQRESIEQKVPTSAQAEERLDSNWASIGKEEAPRRSA